MDTYYGGNPSPYPVQSVFSWHGFQYVQLRATNWPGFTPAQTLLLAFKTNSNLTQTGWERVLDCTALYADDAHVAHIEHRDVASAKATTAVADLPDGAFLNRFNDIIVRTHLNNLAGALPTDW